MAHLGIEINEYLSINENTTAEEIADMIAWQGHERVDIKRAIEVYGKFQAKKGWDKAVQVALDNE